MCLDECVLIGEIVLIHCTIECATAIACQVDHSHATDHTPPARSGA
jgi:hypothetical protein